MRLAFAGTPEPAVPTLRALLDSSHEVVAVITRPASRSGRGRTVRPSPVAAVADEAGVPVLTPPQPDDPDFLAALTELGVDCCAVVAYGALLRPVTLAVPVHGWINLHFSLLPAWRGAAPVQYALLHGDDVTGASTFRIEEGLDTGPVFGVVTEAVAPTDTAGDLLTRLASSGAGLMVATLDGIEAGALSPVAQPGGGVSYAPKVTVDDAHVDWTVAAQHVDRRVRACTPAPGAWTEFRGDRVKLGPVRVSTVVDLAPGEIRVEKSEVLVGTSTRAVELGTVQPPGKRPMPAGDWARGARLEEGARFG